MFRIFSFIGLWLFVNSAVLAFDVYDGTLYKNKPNLSSYRLKPISIVYEGAIFPNSTTLKFPDNAAIDKVSRAIKNSNQRKVVIDIERWPLVGSDITVRNAVGNYNKFIKSLKLKGLSGVSLGYYGNLPVRDYWGAVDKTTSTKYKNWQRDNDRVKSLAGVVDTVYPSIYTFYNDQLAWRQYAIAQISEARRVAPGKPVIAFLWPHYHEASPIPYRNQYVAADFWRQQLETMYRVADGVVIWGGWQEQWDPSAPWWQETLKFMQAHNI